jgi:hypothetical protein
VATSGSAASIQDRLTVRSHFRDVRPYGMVGLGSTMSEERVSLVSTRARVRPSAVGFDDAFSRVPSPGYGVDSTELVHRWALAGTLAALAVGIATASVLGPLVLGVMEYRTSATMENQFLGSDAAALFVIAPLALAASVWAARGHRVVAPLAAGIGVYAVYTDFQNIVGQEYLRLPGNAERFFPLLLAVFVLAQVAVVLSVAQLSWLPRLPRGGVRVGPHPILPGEADGPRDHRPGRVGDWNRPVAWRSVVAAGPVSAVDRLYVSVGLGDSDGGGDVGPQRS